MATLQTEVSQTSDGTRERHVLVVLPHPDDETFGCGGTIATFARQGVPITYACGTLGQMGRNMGKPFFATRESLPAVRDKELEAACEVLGITDLRKLGLRDKTVEFEDPEVLADKIEAILRETNPSLVITHYPGHGVHPDHNALGSATMRAIARLPKTDRPRIYAHAITKNREEVLGPPDVVNDISSVAEVKAAAAKAHRSQSEAMMSWLGASTSDEKYAEQLRRNFSREVFWLYEV